MSEQEYNDILDIYSSYVDACMTTKIDVSIAKRALAIIMLEIESRVEQSTYKDIVDYILKKYKDQNPRLFLAGHVIDSLPKILDEVKDNRFIREQPKGEA